MDSQELCSEIQQATIFIRSDERTSVAPRAIVRFIGRQERLRQIREVLGIAKRITWNNDTYILEYGRQRDVIDILEPITHLPDLDPETSRKVQQALEVAQNNVERQAAEPAGRSRAPNEMFVKAVWGDRFDWDSEHFKRTPDRFETMLHELTDQKPFDFTTFDATNVDEMVVIRNIDFVSLCAHHIVPFMGKCQIGYVPKKRIAGLSKFARLVKYHAANLTVQEELTQAIKDSLEELLEPAGVAVVMEAEHLCMTIRGVQSPGTTTVTSAMSGIFADHTRLARSEFLNLIKGT